MSAEPTMRHIVVFALYEDITESDRIKAMALLRTLGDDMEGVLEWVVAQSLDTRKGVLLIENGLFRSPKDLTAFRAHPRHHEVAEFMKTISDWKVVDYLEG